MVQALRRLPRLSDNLLSSPRQLCIWQPPLPPPPAEQAAGYKRSPGTGAAVISRPGIPAHHSQEVPLSLIQGTAVA